jgi:hypothetical protein
LGHSDYCQSNEYERVIKNFLIFFDVADIVGFVWQKCGIFCLGRQDFDRIGNNGKKIKATEFFAQLP